MNLNGFCIAYRKIMKNMYFCIERDFKRFNDNINYHTALTIFSLVERITYKAYLRELRPVKNVSPSI